MMTPIQTLSHTLVLAKARVSAAQGVLNIDLSKEGDPELATEEVSLVCRCALIEAIGFLQSAQIMVQELSKTEGKA